MTNNQLEDLTEEYGLKVHPVPNPTNSDGYNEGDVYSAHYNGFLKATNLITNHLKSLPLDQMTGKEVEESLWNEFLHIQ